MIDLFYTGADMRIGVVWAIETAMTSVKQVLVVSAVFAMPPSAIVSPYCGQKPKINRHC